MSSMAWPVKLAFRKSDAVLYAEFDDGKSGTVSYKRLREQSPSAAVRGHGGGPPPPQAPVPHDISVLRADPVGRYALRIVFSDGHDSGLYNWDLIRKLTVGDEAVIA
ncbi:MULTISPECIES: DUF971 domain-containing protein [Hyphomonas]|uniref:Gamma-butyrobetaine hydroxylase-like N-terminal domain-containing protein n=1 Tax=Hyphomonas adhaerens TaxID=81029 RepID=A0A3B9GY37_9PROT|nr:MULTISPECIES: DUF971 domain-containing protein [Hyphomonas]MBB39337.1 hypothetical protein [Hyphomonas sp.]HAE27363.1 hypothetical protein [Hyphomonas adhaerens]|tara:strand:- start:978 stop:1298 length:321 start_codon:yes stop_codon:yes gene_type:complete